MQVGVEASGKQFLELEGGPVKMGCCEVGQRVAIVVSEVQVVDTKIEVVIADTIESVHRLSSRHFV